MKDKLAEKSINLKDMDKLGKSPYARPVLRVFGSVGVLTLGAAGTQCDGSKPGSKNPKTAGVCLSDRSAKESIARIGTHPLSFGLYLFDYKPEFREEWGSDRQFGVMADEVETVMPDAVLVHPDGYKMVNYAMLGISRSVH